jgi:hypothetical protein
MFPGYPCTPTGCGTIGAGGFGSRSAVFGSPTVKSVPPLTNVSAGLFENFATTSVILGRWSDGVISSSDPAAAVPTLTLSPNVGVHWIVGRPTSSTVPGPNDVVEFAPPSTLGSGQIDLAYNLVAATKPTNESGRVAPGTFTGSAILRMTSSTAFLGFLGRVTIAAGGGSTAGPPPTVTYTLSTVGGLTNPSTSVLTRSMTAPDAHVRFEGPLQVSSSACPSPTCSIGPSGLFIGYLYGSSYRYLAFNYDINDPLAGGVITGAAVLERPAGTAPGSGDTVLSARHLILNGIGNLSALIPNADQMTLNPTGDTYIAGKTGGPVLRRETAKKLDSGFAGGSTPATAVITWERWAKGYVSGGVNSHFDGNSGVHLVHGQPATALPTGGTFTYNLVGATKPTIRDGSLAPGTFNGQMAVQFGTSAKVGVDFNVGIGGHNYNVKSAGGVATPGSSQINLTPSGTFAVTGLPVAPGGPACGGASCSANVNGFLAGPGGIFAGVGYAIGQPGPGGNPGKVVTGGAAFRRP